MSVPLAVDLWGSGAVVAFTGFIVYQAVRTKQFRWYTYAPVCVGIVVVLGLIILSDILKMHGEVIRRNERLMQLRHKPLRH